MANDAFDVIIIGAGTAGVVAAIQSARAGASTLLVEKTGMLGGTVTTGGVPNPGLFHAWHRQIIAGIGWELVLRTLAETGQAPPVPLCDPRRHSLDHVHVDRFLFAAICDEAVVESGAGLLLHTMVAAVAPAGEGWTVTLCTKTGLTTRTARALIDCTGDANAVALAGLPLEVPEETQPATLSCHAGGYDVSALDTAALNEAMENAVQRGELQYTDSSWNTAQANVSKWLASGGENASHVHHINARDSEGKTKLELEARRALLRLYRFLRQQPGLERLRLEHMAPECGVRETVTIRGKKMITVGDYTSGRLWDDAVCYSYYPLDLHVSSGQGLDGEPLPEGVVPTIPRGAMLPEGSRNLLVAGRCLSSDRLANSALRVQATSMATGQAAGAMAALTTQTGTEVEALPMEAIHSLLAEHAAIVPPHTAVTSPHTAVTPPHTLSS
ncbi:MAG: FAD-dependent oxidoreductase [Armatimonadia bacterium]